MRQNVDELIQILRAEYTAYGHLAETAQMINAALRANNPNDVRRLSMRYDAQTADVEPLEEKRLAVCDSLAAALRLPDRHANLETMINALPAELRPPLIEVRLLLKERIKQLSKINISNQILLQESLDAIARTMQALTAAGPDRFAPYRREGCRCADVMRRNIVNKTA